PWCKVPRHSLPSCKEHRQEAVVDIDVGNGTIHRYNFICVEKDDFRTGGKFFEWQKRNYRPEIINQ
ncbi:hypothetical protein, partial [Candidatus Vampirococcus lugosii]